MKRRLQYLILFLAATFSNCSEDAPVQQIASSNKGITSFSIDGYTTSLDSVNNTIFIEVPAGTDLSGILPVIEVSSGATITPKSGEPIPSSKIYTVTAEDNSVRSFAITVLTIYGLQTVLLTHENGSSYAAVLNHTEATLNFGLSYDDQELLYNSGKKLKLSASLSPGYEIFPDNGYELENYNTLPEPIVITAPNGAQYQYEPLIQNTDNKLQEMKIFDDDFSHAVRTANEYPEYTQGLPENSFVCRVLTNVDLTNIKPFSFDASLGATISPSVDQNYDFSVDRIFTITSESGAAKAYTFRVVQDQILVQSDRPNAHFTLDNSGSPFFVVYIAVSDVSAVRLININNDTAIACSFTNTVNSNGTTTLDIDPSESIPAGDYRLELTLANGYVKLLNLDYTAF
jgi:hypothetical protein